MDDLRARIKAVLDELIQTHLYRAWPEHLMAVGVDEVDAGKWGVEIAGIVDEYERSLRYLFDVLEQEDVASTAEELEGWLAYTYDYSVWKFDDQIHYLETKGQLEKYLPPEPDDDEEYPGTFQIRQGTVEDAGQIALHRRLIFAAHRDFPPESLAALETRYQSWVTERMERGEYIGWFAVNEADEIMAGAGVWLRECPISPDNLTGRDAHVMDVYRHSNFPGQDIAPRLLQTVIDWCKKQGLVNITLEASGQGHLLYYQLGLTAMNIRRMRLR